MGSKSEGLISIPINDRSDFLASIPWLALLPKSMRYDCAATIPGKSRNCKIAARFLYIFENGEMKYLCTAHVYTRGLNGWPEEVERFDEWTEKYYTREWDISLLDRA